MIYALSGEITMTNNKLMFLMTALISINTSMVMGAELSEKDAFARTVCKEMVNLYAYSKGAIDKNDLAVFLEYKDIKSTDELIAVLEHGKTMLSYDIVDIKTENKSALSYWAALLAAPVTAVGGFAGYAHEDIEHYTSQCNVAKYTARVISDERNAKLIAPYVLSNGKFDSDKYFNDVKSDRRLENFMGNHLFDQYGFFNEKYHRQLCVQDAQSRIDRFGLVDGKFDIDAYDRLNPKPVAYIMQNMLLYKGLIAAGLIAIPVVVYKLYGHYMRTHNKQKEIATLDTIIEQIKLIQHNEVQ